MKTQIFSVLLLFHLLACDNNKRINTSNGKQSAEKSIAELYPPIHLKDWEKTPVINGRLPTEEETKNGSSLLYYPNPGPDVKPYNMTLPKLAYYTDAKTKKQTLVVVIQIVQTAQDTMVAYRPLSGLNGASIFRDFRFLTEEEVKNVQLKTKQ